MFNDYILFSDAVQRDYFEFGLAASTLLTDAQPNGAALPQLEVDTQLGGLPILSNEGGMPPTTRQSSSQKATAQFGLSPISDVMQYMHMYDD